MKSLIIVVEFRKPNNKEEAELYGECVTENKSVSRVFINSEREPESRIDTFFHEMAHAFMHWRGKKGGPASEKLAREVGRAAHSVFTGVTK